MPPEQPDDPARLDPPQAEVVLGDLGLAMLAAGYAVTDVTAALKATGAAHGCPEMRFAVFPHAVLIDGPGRNGRTWRTRSLASR